LPEKNATDIAFLNLHLNEQLGDAFFFRQLSKDGFDLALAAGDSKVSLEDLVDFGDVKEFSAFAAPHCKEPLIVCCVDILLM
jgi:hypothetical protein